MALGAQPRGVAGLILGEVTLIIGLGVLTGVLAGLAGGRYVESQLFGVKALDPVVFGIGVATVLTVSLAAGIIPAWRAARIDPMHALRYE
jgi:ABC-type antimicrobial peptide transport system permease subunit